MRVEVNPRVLHAAFIMTALELCRWLRSLHPVPEPSVDRVVVGDASTVVSGVALAWMPTWAALREAAARGLNVVVAHEPTFYTHGDLDGFEAAFAGLPSRTRDAVTATREAKQRWIEESGLVVIRCHDVLDAMPGGVVDCLAAALGFPAAAISEPAPRYRIARLPRPTRAAEVAERLARAFVPLGQPGVAFYGEADRLVSSLGLGTGYGNDPWKHFSHGADMALAIDDRIKSWTEPAWAEDAGYPVVVINHGTSEEWGVRQLAEIVRNAHPALRVELLAQGCGYRWIAAPASAPRSSG
jgi:putative NIF3 family GTP cyclohydrolase 1 type 2